MSNSNSPTPNSNDTPDADATPCSPGPKSDRLNTASHDPAAVDPFDDLDSLRLSQDFASAVGVKKVITTVPCRKPNRHEFVRVRQGEEWRFETGVFEDRANRETYLVQSSLWPELLGEISPTCLFLAMNRQGDAFLWPTKLPSDDRRTNSWNESALSAARLAETQWIRVAANLGAGSYDTFAALGEIPDPKWPDLTFKAMLKLCFQNRMIDSADHEVLRALRGER